MADYFTSDHFKLLKRWKGQKRDESNPEQNQAYEELTKGSMLSDAIMTMSSLNLIAGELDA